MPSPADHLAQNPDLQGIIVLNLQRAVKLSVDLASYLITETDAENLQDRVRAMPLRPDDADTDHPQPLKSIEGHVALRNTLLRPTGLSALQSWSSLSRTRQESGNGICR